MLQRLKAAATCGTAHGAEGAGGQEMQAGDGGAGAESETPMTLSQRLSCYGIRHQNSAAAAAAVAAGAREAEGALGETPERKAMPSVPLRARLF